MTHLDAPASEPILRAARPEDEARLRAALDRACSAVDSGHRPRTAGEQAWRMHARPFGSRSIVAVDSAGGVLAHFSSWPRPARVGGEDVWASHAIDSFVDPHAQPGLARKRLFERVVEEYVARHASGGARHDRFSWGLPVRNAFRLGEARLGYELLEPAWILRADALAAAATGTGAGRLECAAVESGAEIGPEFGELFERVAAEHAAILSRDPEWLAWRWMLRPGGSARLLVARRHGEPVGWAVWTPGAWEGESGALLCDWIVPASEPLAAQTLLERVFEEARALGALPVRVLFPPRSRQFGAFQELGFRVTAAARIVAGRSFERSRGVDWWSSNLWWTLGDTDLC